MHWVSAGPPPYVISLVELVTREGGLVCRAIRHGRDFTHAPKDPRRLREYEHYFRLTHGVLTSNSAFRRNSVFPRR